MEQERDVGGIGVVLGRGWDVGGIGAVLGGGSAGCGKDWGSPGKGFESDVTVIGLDFCCVFDAPTEGLGPITYYL